MESMTGYGESHFNLEGVKFSFYVRSLNSRFFEATFNFPSELRWFEGVAGTLLKKRFSRGKIDVILERDVPSPSFSNINVPLLNNYEQIFQRLYNRKRVNIPMDVLIHLPNIFEVKTISWQPFGNKFEFYYLRALARVKRARQKEGKKIRSIINKKIKDIKRLNRKNSIIQKRDLKEQEQLFNQKLEYLIDSNKEFLEKRMNLDRGEFMHSLWNIARDDFRHFIQSDSTEEIDRIRMHLEEVAEKMDSEESMGKILEFFFQEVLREVNTVASKTRNIDMNRNAVFMKSFIEEIREQLRNIE